ncbi:proteasome regulatory particle base subunit rpn10 [Friedmanniomyces endolithicus]|nr:proteasome regulatory particle base subunit rpn10 [Friedmanniomyces endolithicus]KAK0778971.1 proteasome regulatory particle base subunit rpn10 [Friedmanniomyces endolithicus]KAK0786294.1 proteasome regulatory particle base subunit rpn10 [Friedmanniomyces endolithicus]KAK0814597.1 proteasome regulatory particle base subunit rpn10 [Friedmanniomyces endolithicus]KAK0855245.1 proteasome regulatory particle base subunit rpn10 [Friedmanniomyces endolithicus]
MVLESVMIVVDNSESSRNGDYPPSRWSAQSDAANLIFHSKTQDNPESSCGLMSLAGNATSSSSSSGPGILTTLTTNPGKILDGLHRTKIRGTAHFSTGVSIASLALKHRQNKSSRQRIVVFVCSPILEGEAALVKLGKRMKKNGTSVDVVAFGDLTDENLGKLRAFNEAVKGGDGSHLEIVPPGPNLLSDSIVASPILAGEGGPQGGEGGVEGGAGGAGRAGAGNDFEFGVDPSLDPELALVLRMSMEEERERQAREQRTADEAEGKTKLESVAEEGGKAEGESSGAGAAQEHVQIDGNGEAAGSAASTTGLETEVRRPEDKKKEGDGDEMDTA